MKNVSLIKSKFLRNLLDQNSFILTTDKEAVIVDAGAELEDVKEVVGNKKVLAVLLTHLHFDHFWNLDKYLEEFGCPVYISKDFEWKFCDSKANGSCIIRKELTRIIPQNKIKYYAKFLELGAFKLEIIPTPGHSKDSVCILWDRNLF